MLTELKSKIEALKGKTKEYQLEDMYKETLMCYIGDVQICNKEELLGSDAELDEYIEISELASDAIKEAHRVLGVNINPH